MKRRWVNSMNVVNVAQNLFQFDFSHIPEKHHRDAQSLIAHLQQALEHYVNPTAEQRQTKKWQNIDSIYPELATITW